IEERIDLLRQLEPADTFFRPAEQGAGRAHRRQLVRRVGIELDRAAIVPLALVEFAPMQQDPAQRLLAFVVVSVDRDRALRVLQRAVDPRVVATKPVTQQQARAPGWQGPHASACSNSRCASASSSRSPILVSAAWARSTQS